MRIPCSLATPAMPAFCRTASDDPLFTRLLTFLSTLSENGEKYMDEGVDNSNMVLAGEISEE